MMGFLTWWDDVHHVVNIAQEDLAAVAAARAAFDHGDGPIAALDAFAAATTNSLDDAVVQRLREGLRQALTALHEVSGAVAGTLAHEAQVKDAVTSVMRFVADVGYRAGALRAQLTTWLEPPRAA